MTSPWRSRSSPVLTTTVRSAPTTACSPSASLAPPTPPASSTTRGTSVEVIVDGADPDPEADPLLLLERADAVRRGLRILVPMGHRRDIRLRLGLVADRLGGAEQAHPAHRVRLVEDGEVDPRVA